MLNSAKIILALQRKCATVYFQNNKVGARAAPLGKDYRLSTSYILHSFLTNRFYFTMRMFSYMYRSQMTSKFDKCKNTKVAQKVIAECVTDALTTF